jgi:hypothetical protein
MNISASSMKKQYSINTTSAVSTVNKKEKY